MLKYIYSTKTLKNIQKFKNQNNIKKNQDIKSVLHNNTH